MKKQLLFLSALIFGVTASAQNADQYDAQVPEHYFSFSLKLVKESPGFTPPVAARAFGFAGLTLYEAVVPGIPNYTSTEGAIYELNSVSNPDANANYHWPTVANNALAAILDSLFANATQLNKDSLHAIRDNYNATFSGQISNQDYLDSKAFGEAVADDIFQYSKLDGGHQAYSANFPGSYVPPVGASLWVPYGPQVALQPYFGSHRPFIEDDTISVLPAVPPVFSTDTLSVFYGYVNQVYTTVNSLDQEQTNIAQFWADGTGSITPPGHSISLLNGVVTAENSNLEVATLAYAKLGIALSDAFLACWKAKYIHNLCRPITYVQAYIDPLWVSLIGTPPFPEYPSGHSSQSGAMSEVLENIFGASYTFTDNTHGSSFGGPRSFTSFDQAAEEAAISRLYGGIHYEFANNNGLGLGRAVGENVNELFGGLVTSVAQNAVEGPKLQVYPNPSASTVSIDVLGMHIDKLEVFNLYGQLIAERESKGILDVSAYAPGVYMVKAYDLKRGLTVNQRLVRQ